ncbi:MULTISPECIES: hypothetical protein [Streptacidiphilus]|uniref:Uncharacterized protein n=1 Tax=Streptacidiphilus cavernicola TaxID=3342716 RepID=A0ABV6USL2_9ACTN|nr:hypothetical protein [Streptacidiphilus jeojiense]
MTYESGLLDGAGTTDDAGRAVEAAARAAAGRAQGGGAAGAGRAAREPRRPRLLALRSSGGPTGQLGWSLVAGNGRQLARSATLYRSGAELLDSLRELRADRHALRCLLSQRQGRSWLWTAHLPARRSGEREGAAVACGARTYLRQDQCRKGMAGFLAALDLLPDEAWALVLPVDPKW